MPVGRAHCLIVRPHFYLDQFTFIRCCANRKPTGDQHHPVFGAIVHATSRTNVRFPQWPSFIRLVHSPNADIATVVAAGIFAPSSADQYVRTLSHAEMTYLGSRMRAVAELFRRRGCDLPRRHDPKQGARHFSPGLNGPGTLLLTGSRLCRNARMAMASFSVKCANACQGIIGASVRPSGRTPVWIEVTISSAV